MKFNMSPKSKIIIQVRLILMASIIAFLLGALSVILFWIAIFLAALTLISFFIFNFKVINVLIKYNSIEINDDLIIITKGILYTRHYILPDNRLIYIEVVKTPLESIFSLTRLIFYTSGEKIYFDLIDKYDAENIINHVAGGEK